MFEDENLKVGNNLGQLLYTAYRNGTCRVDVYHAFVYGYASRIFNTGASSPEIQNQPFSQIESVVFAFHGWTRN
jgi:hypothetical protein